LTDQIRRSSRSVCSNISEAWAKMIYPKHFISKLTDSLGEEYETETGLDYSRDCGYISKETRDILIEEYQEVKKMLNSMINNADKFGPKLLKIHHLIDRLSTSILTIDYRLPTTPHFIK